MALSYFSQLLLSNIIYDGNYKIIVKVIQALLVSQSHFN